MADMASVASQLFGRAMRSIQDLADTSIRIQQDSITGLLEGKPFRFLPLTSFPAIGEVAVNQVIAVTQKNTDEVLIAMEKNVKACTDLWRAAMTIREKPELVGQDSSAGFVQTALRALHANTETAMCANVRMIDAAIRIGIMPKGTKVSHHTQAA